MDPTSAYAAYYLPPPASLVLLEEGDKQPANLDTIRRVKARLGQIIAELQLLESQLDQAAEAEAEAE